MKYREFIKIIAAEGFVEVRARATHRQYEGYHSGRRWMVTVDYSQLGEDIQKRNLSSMIKQSGLSKKLFR